MQSKVPPIPPTNGVSKRNPIKQSPTQQLQETLEMPKRRFGKISLLNIPPNTKPVDAFNPSPEDYRFLKNNKPLVSELKKRTKFSTKEIESLMLLFYRFSNKKEVLLKEEFVHILANTLDLTDEYMCERIIGEILRKVKSKMYITISIWVEVFSLYLRGSLEEKMRYCFNVYDITNKGFIGKGVLFRFLQIQMLNDTDSTADFVEIIMKKMDLDRDGKISFDDYRNTVKKYPVMLEFLGPCLPDQRTVYKMLCTFTKVKKYP